MKALFASALLLSAASAARAQEPAAKAPQHDKRAAASFSGAAAEKPRFPLTALAVDAAIPTSVDVLEGPPFRDGEGEARTAPAPLPAQDRRVTYRGEDEYRWQLGIGADWIRFRSSVFSANTVGIKSSVTYFTKAWFGFEGNVSAAFGPMVFPAEHAKVLVYGAGPKIIRRERRWEPWVHAIVGGSHEQPQTAGNSRNSFAIELGGGTDYRFHPRFSGRFEANWVRTNFFGQSQNHLELAGGPVFHFH